MRFGNGRTRVPTSSAHAKGWEMKLKLPIPPLIPTLLVGHEYRMQLARYTRLVVAHGPYTLTRSYQSSVVSSSIGRVNGEAGRGSKPPDENSGRLETTAARLSSVPSALVSGPLS